MDRREFLKSSVFGAIAALFAASIPNTGNVKEAVDSQIPSIDKYHHFTYDEVDSYADKFIRPAAEKLAEEIDKEILRIYMAGA